MSRIDYSMARKCAKSDAIEFACPSCEATGQYDHFISIEPQEFVCVNCRGPFSVVVAFVRSKHSRHFSSNGFREFSIRIVDDSGNQDLIEFSKKGRSDFDFKSGDLAVFIYGGLGSGLTVVENVTIGRSLWIRRSWKDIVITIISFLLLILFLLFAWFLAAQLL